MNSHKMSDLKVCRICLRTEARMYHIHSYQLKSYFEEVMALNVNESDGLPDYFCYECAVILHKFHKFKEKCYCGQKALKELLWCGPITYESIYKIDRGSKNLNSNLQIMNVTKQVKSYIIKDRETIEANKTDDRILKTEIECNVDLDRSDINHGMDIVPVDYDIHSPSTVIINCKKEAIKLEFQEFKEHRKSKDVSGNDTIKNRRARKLLDSTKWVKVNLTEDEALKEFRARADDVKYAKALYKCTDCLKGFSKDEMLKRHIKLRHVESLGSFECRFCRMRFKWDSHLRIHMNQHFTKFQCQRCHFVCSLENSAYLHEEYHSGTRRKCIHCGEVFRHPSTYYTHLRTSHRSGYICTMCGVSFVSEIGLHQHKKVKHVSDGCESPDDFEDVDTYCEKCDVRFDTRKAYQEHMFHSVMHAEGVENEVRDEITIPRKVLGKKMRAKIINQMTKRKTDDESLTSSSTKRRRKAKRKSKKPTTCHQCGKHFETQSECRKHHQSEHPRTCFYPPNQRHICELCGASLAPGSVATHQNMHTRERVHSCSTCGKQFHSSVGLKRHLVTHTGEKPYGCSLCQKRFTQSNSMKLHYRTFHLKQPYPKRNRRKTKKEGNDSVEVQDSESEEQSEEESLQEREPDRLPDSGIDHTSEVMPEENITEESVHYLTLN